MRKVFCDYCGQQAEYVDSKIIYGRSYGMMYLLRVDRYPCILTIKPLGGMDAQLTMLEADDVSYISPDASIVFAYIDGDLSIKISETFTISDALLSKIKRLFVNLYSTWTQFFFRYIMVHNLIQTEDNPALWPNPFVDETDEDAPDDIEE